MSSARIDLSSNGIDRTKPAIMDPYMPDDQWNTFCDDVDNSLRPIKEALKIHSIGFKLTPVIFLIFMIISFVTVFSGGGFSIFILFIIPIVFFLATAATSRHLFHSMSKIKTELERICKNTSDKQPFLSFHIRYEMHPRYYMNSYNSSHNGSNYHTTQYIEVLINDQNINMDPEIVIPEATVVSATNIEPSAPYVDDLEAAENKKNNTPEERLQTLEQMKHLLTQKEYENKRAEILSEI